MGDREVKQLLLEKVQQHRNAIVALEFAIDALDGVSAIDAPKFAHRGEAIAKAEPVVKNGKRYKQTVDRGILRARLDEVLKPGEKIGPKEFGRRIRKLGMPYKNPASALHALRKDGLLVGTGKPRNMVYQLADDAKQAKFSLDN